MGRPTTFPMGTTNYQPDKCWNGYTLFSANEHGAMLINMNGEVVRFWKDLQGFPNRMLPGGIVFGNSGERSKITSYQDKVDLLEVDWDGNIIWKFDKHEYIEDPGEKPQWMARQHHDFQREGNPVGYYVPGFDANPTGGNTMILAHTTVKNAKISPKALIDDCIYEVDWEGNKVWEWKMSDHFDEIGFSELEKNTLYRNPNIQACGQGDWMHINSMSLLGPNPWYDQGDERFHPDNIIIDSRETGMLAIISKQTGKLVWKVGPDFNGYPFGAIVGVHHCHMIPKGLPGAGNVLLFDNGGFSGYGAPSNTSEKGLKVNRRDFTRVLEINPITYEVVWQFSAKEMGIKSPAMQHYFYSPLVSSAQRMPNGNTLITEGSSGRIIEVTKDHEIVWEYISPYAKKNDPNHNGVYRAYRYPYDWVPQLDRPEEVPIVPIKNEDFRLPGAAGKEFDAVTVNVNGTWGYANGESSCVEKA